MQQPQAALRPAGRLHGPSLGVSITGFSYYLPKDVITNADLTKILDTSHEWIVERTGIHLRHRAAAQEATSDLGLIAARGALERAGLSPEDLDLILVATATPDAPVPATSCLIQARLGAWQAPAMDLNAGCSGFLYALHTGACFVRSGCTRHVLVVGAETLTRVTDYADRRSCILFGDGAGAAVLSQTSLAPPPDVAPMRLELVYASLGTDGAEANLISIPAGGSRNPASEETIRARAHYLRLDGTAVFRQAVRRMSEAAREALETTGLTPDDVDWLVPHQANARIVLAVADQTGIPASKAMLDVAETGNTSAASIPITLGRAQDAGLLKPGQCILMLAFGAGLTWGCQLWRVHANSAR
jgi:3-oxoacyl-[acyl-carrier-protein] synthase-3